MPKIKIIGEKKQLNTHLRNQKMKKTKLKKAKTAVAQKKTVALNTSNSKKLKTFYFLSVQECGSTFVPGELNKSELKDLLSCAKIHYKTSRIIFDDIIEDAPSFATQLSLNVSEYLIELKFTLSTDTYVEEYKQTLPFDIDDLAIATLWKSVGHDVESVENPDNYMLSKYATSALFNLSTEGETPPQLYFLAQYK